MTPHIHTILTYIHTADLLYWLMDGILKNINYLQLTSTAMVRLDAVPIPLYAVQRYVPVEVLLLSSSNFSPVNSTSLSLLLSTTLVQVMFGGGSPIAIHSNVILPGSPSTTS